MDANSPDYQEELPEYVKVTQISGPRASYRTFVQSSSDILDETGHIDEKVLVRRVFSYYPRNQWLSQHDLRESFHRDLKRQIRILCRLHPELELDSHAEFAVQQHVSRRVFRTLSQSHFEMNLSESERLHGELHQDDSDLVKFTIDTHVHGDDGYYFVEGTGPWDGDEFVYHECMSLPRPLLIFSGRVEELFNRVPTREQHRELTKRLHPLFFRDSNYSLLNCSAFYRPMCLHGGTGSEAWGIHLIVPGLVDFAADLARRIVRVDAQELIQFAHDALYEHEYMHLVCDSVKIKLATDNKVDLLDFEERYHEKYFGYPPEPNPPGVVPLVDSGPLEEAAAEARSHRKSTANRTARMKKALTESIREGGPGYNEFEKVIGHKGPKHECLRHLKGMFLDSRPRYNWHEDFIDIESDLKLAPHEIPVYLHTYTDLVHQVWDQISAATEIGDDDPLILTAEDMDCFPFHIYQLNWSEKIEREIILFGPSDRRAIRELKRELEAYGHGRVPVGKLRPNHEKGSLYSIVVPDTKVKIFLMKDDARRPGAWFVHALCCSECDVPWIECHC